MNPWIMRELAALHCEELKRAAGRARANLSQHRGRRPVTPRRDAAYPVPNILAADVLERLAALAAFEDA
jgi:hypothetical protein